MAPEAAPGKAATEYSPRARNHRRGLPRTARALERDVAGAASVVAHHLGLRAGRANPRTRRRAAGHVRRAIQAAPEGSLLADHVAVRVARAARLGVDARRADRAAGASEGAEGGGTARASDGAARCAGALSHLPRSPRAGRDGVAGDVGIGPVLAGQGAGARRAARRSRCGTRSRRCLGSPVRRGASLRRAATRRGHHQQEPSLHARAA